MTLKTLVSAFAVLLSATTVSLAQSQPNYGPNAPATGDSFGKPPSGASPPMRGDRAYTYRAHQHYGHRHCWWRHGHRICGW